MAITLYKYKPELNKIDIDNPIEGSGSVNAVIDIGNMTLLVIVLDTPSIPTDHYVEVQVRFTAKPIDDVAPDLFIDDTMVMGTDLFTRYFRQKTAGRQYILVPAAVSFNRAQVTVVTSSDFDTTVYVYPDMFNAFTNSIGQTVS